ncbi:MAG TPA: DUF6648 family protein [Pseudobacteroides sp.]|uniref:DUF6648 family protein n=1 Tax=Pseudobacteroides sp. TaxID=1968840 RepID=UPI002F93BDC7
MILSKFDKFLIHRQSLIEQYTKGDMTKDEFIEANYAYINSTDLVPFKKLDNVKKAIFNYQYYNVLAKYYQKRAHELNSKHGARSDFFEQANYFYSKKDHVTLKLLELLDFQGVEAYYVRVKSPALKRKLFEIVLKDHESLILHSKNETLLNILIRESVFINEVRTSLVDDYINQRY